MTPAQEDLIRRHLKIVHSLVKTHTPPDPWRREDLISAGYEALCEAVLRWQPEQDVTFGSFVYQRIQGAFLDELRRLRFGKRSKEARDPRYFNCDEAEAMAAPDQMGEFEIDQLLRDLPERDQLIVRRRIEGFSGTEISQEFGVSISRVSQVTGHAYRQIQGRVVIAA